MHSNVHSSITDICQGTKVIYMYTTYTHTHTHTHARVCARIMEHYSVIKKNELLQSFNNMYGVGGYYAIN